MTHYENRVNRQYMESCISETLTLQRQVIHFQVNEYVFILNVYSNVLNKVMNDLEAIYRAHHPYDETAPPTFLPSDLNPTMLVTDIPTTVMNHAHKIQDSLGTSGYNEAEEQGIWSDMDTWMNFVGEIDMETRMNNDGETDMESEVGMTEDDPYVVRNLESEFNEFYSRLPYNVIESDTEDWNMESVFDDAYYHVIEEDDEPLKPLPTLQQNVLADSMSLNICGICLDSHNKLESVACACTHEFGQDCFQGWINACRNNKQNITCPCCRAPVFELINFVV